MEIRRRTFPGLRNRARHRDLHALPHSDDRCPLVYRDLRGNRSMHHDTPWHLRKLHLSNLRKIRLHHAGGERTEHPRPTGIPHRLRRRAPWILEIPSLAAFQGRKADSSGAHRIHPRFPGESLALERQGQHPHFSASEGRDGGRAGQGRSGFFNTKRHRHYAAD